MSKRVIVALVLGLFVAGPRVGWASAFTGDARLQQKRTIQAHDTTLLDLLADLEVRTGVRFFGDKALYNDRVTVFAHERPLADTLDAIASFFGLEWKREGKAGAYVYTLYQTDASRAQEAVDRKELAAGQAEGVKALLEREVTAYGEFSRLKRTELVQRAADLAHLLVAESDMDRQQESRVNIAVIRNLLSDDDSWRVIYKFLQTLSPEERRGLVGAGRTAFSYPSARVGHLLPSVALEEEDDSPSASVLDRRADGSTSYITADLQFASDLDSDPRLAWTLASSRRIGYNSSSMTTVGLLPSAPVLVRSKDAPPDEPTDAKSDAALTAAVDFARRTGDADARPLGEILERFDGIHPADVIADAFRGTRLQADDLSSGSYADLLTQAARLTSHRWWRQDGFVMMRSRTYAVDRWSEPPSDRVADWSKLAEQGALELSDYTEIAQLPDQQYATLMRLAVQHVVPAGLERVLQARRPLRIWGALTSAQRRRAETDGVKYSDLSADQKALWTKLLVEAGVEDDDSPWVGRPRRRGAWAESSRLTLAREQSGVWGAVGHRWFIGLTYVPEKTQAYLALKAFDPTMKLEETEKLTLVTVLFNFDTDGRRLGTGRLVYPTRATPPDDPGG